MPQLKKKNELSQDANVLASSYSYVRHGHVIYVPTDYETGDDSVTPPPERTCWLPVTREYLRRKALTQFDTLFETEQSLASFEFMVGQVAQQNDDHITSLLVRTKDGLRELKEDGKLYEPTGKFIPNTLKPMLNDDPADKAEVMGVISNWLNSEEEAVAMLRHFATALVPHWSAVKYVLLLGAGRNGKSLMMHMLQAIFGSENCSMITRQEISDKSSVITALNGKLLNVVFDGQAVYLKDSGTEKSIVAGERVSIRKLYSSEHTPVQTKALFVEGLNREPKSSDKSTALQSRIIRFWFPNVYDVDDEFWVRMMSEQMIGALLSLLIDNYVRPKEAAVMLAPTSAALELQLEHMFENSYGLQFIKFIEETDSEGADVLIDMEFSELVQRFQAWRIKENDLRPWPEPEVLNVFRPSLYTDRKSRRVGGVPRKVRIITAFTKETLQFIETLRGEDADVDTASVVED